QPSIFDNSGTALPASAIGNVVMFTGRWYDPETGLYDYRHRYLDPRTGRFTTKDPIGIWGDRHNLGHAFAYVANSPLSRTDALGLDMIGIGPVGHHYVPLEVTNSLLNDLNLSDPAAFHFAKVTTGPVPPGYNLNDAAHQLYNKLV